MNRTAQKVTAIPRHREINDFLAGGSWLSDPVVVRSANRYWGGSSVWSDINGFRLARMLP